MPDPGVKKAPDTGSRSATLILKNTLVLMNTKKNLGGEKNLEKKLRSQKAKIKQKNVGNKSRGLGKDCL